MNIPFQTLVVGNGEDLIVLQKKVWKRVLDALEELDDIRAYDKAKANPNKEFFSMDEVAKNVSQTRGSRERSVAQ